MTDQKPRITEKAQRPVEWTLPHTEVHRNSARCLRCGDEIESTDRHELVSCSCGAFFVDGGRAYLRRGWDGSLGDSSEVFEDTSETTLWEIDYDDQMREIGRRKAPSENPSPPGQGTS